MPTTRTKKTRGRVTEAGGITYADYIYFTSGPFFDAENYEQGKTKADLVKFWKTHRETILARYFTEQRNPGQRPWPMWEWELTKPRLITEANKFTSMRVWDRQRKVYDFVETDFDYLKRLGLLEPWEKIG